MSAMPLKAVGMKEIEKVFHVQQMVDGTLKAVTTTEEFKTTLASLRPMRGCR